MRPRAWHDVDHRITASAERHPLARAHLVSELVEGDVRSPLAVHAEGEVGEGVVGVGVTALLGHQDLRLELPDQVGHDGVEGTQPAVVGGAGRQRDVDRAPLGLGPADLLGESRAGKEQLPGLVERDRQDARVVPEGPFDAVPVVHVHVDVGDLLHPLVEQPPDAGGDVVVDAEPGGTAAHRVVEAAHDVGAVQALTGVDLAAGLDARSDDVRAGVVDVREDRVVLGAEAVSQVGLAAPAGPDDRLDVALVVDGEQLLRSAHRRLDDLQMVEHAELAGQAHRQIHADRRHRMRRAEVVVGQAVIEDDRRVPLAGGRLCGRRHRPHGIRDLCDTGEVFSIRSTQWWPAS